jgi:short-subunit dehydrogenase
MNWQPVGNLVVCSAGERLAGAVEQLHSLGVEVTQVQADLATRQGVDELWDAIKRNGCPLDFACINAGVGVGGQFWETYLELELNMVELNCTGTVHLAKHVVGSMQQRNTGKVLFTASIAGEMVAPREAVYATTKAFVLSFAHRITLDQAPEMYKVWRDKKENVTKIVIDPWQERSVA